MPADLVQPPGKIPVPKPRISVVIPVYNARRHLEASLNSVVAAMASYGNAELILVDNGSTDGSYEVLRSGYGRLATIHQIKDRTIGFLRNHGARLARGTYLSFIDSDCTVPADYFLSVDAVFADVNPDATGCSYDLPAAPHWIEVLWHQLHRRLRDGYVDYLNSGNLIIKRDVFEKIGGFDETLITGEDAELGQRLRESGFTVYESHRIAAAHLGNPKTLGAFFRKQVWHGLGMLGTARGGRLDKPLVMTLLHVIALATALIGVAALPWSFPARLGLALGLATVVPLATVIYRGLTRQGFARPLPALLLYQLYYDARIWALALILAGRDGGRRC